MVGMTGFEPVTPCFGSMASRPLNYIPIVLGTPGEP
jgi:hypothetical protein